MSIKLEDWKLEIEKAITSLSNNRGSELAAKIRPILYANFDRNRLQSFTEGEISRIRDYVSRVAKCYTTLNTYINRVQIERATEVWEPLFKNLLTWAYNYFLRKNFDRNTAQEQAAECAISAAVIILKAHFPYDTDFDRWAHVIVQNSCKKYIRVQMKKSTVPQQNIVDLDCMLDVLEDPVIQDQQYQQQLRSDLENAIAKLSNARRKVILLTYFEGLTASEIALKMGKTVGAIYNLRFNALVELQKILSEDWNNY